MIAHRQKFHHLDVQIKVAWSFFRLNSENYNSNCFMYLLLYWKNLSGLLKNQEVEEKYLTRTIKVRNICLEKVPRCLVKFAQYDCAILSKMLQQIGGFASRLCTLYFAQCSLTLHKLNKKNVGLKRTLCFLFMIPLMFQRETKCVLLVSLHIELFERRWGRWYKKDKIG